LPKIDSKQRCYSTFEASGGRPTELILTIGIGLISDNNQAKPNICEVMSVF